jgi:hypothetical protein
MWLGLAFLGTRLFIQRKKKRRSLKPKNNNRIFFGASQNEEFKSTRLFIQQKKRRSLKPKNNIGIELSK